MEYFSYKGGCGICGRTCIKAFKRTTGLGYRQVISNKMLFKTVIPLRNYRIKPYYKFKTIMYALLCGPY